MTTIAEFKKMLREEILEPLDHPRVTGLSAEGLASYNEGFQSACALILQENTTFTDSEWVDWKIETCKSCLVGYSESGHGWMAGRRAAFAWALAELEGLKTQRQILTDLKTRADAPDNVLIPRARYNYLLEVERQAATFAESFARWED